MTIETSATSIYHKHLAFGEEEFRNRLARVRERMSEAGLACLVVLAPEDIYYLTGFRSWGFFEWQALIVAPTGDPVMVSRALEERMYHDNSWIDAYRAYRDFEDPVATAVSVLEECCNRGDAVGLPTRSPHLSGHTEHRLQELMPGIAWIDTTDLVAQIRWIKSPAELEVIRQTGELTAAAMGRAIEVAAQGRSENEVIAEWFSFAIAGGSEDPAMGPYIGAGVRSSFGHSSWEGNTLEDGDVIFFEASACIRRYSAPLMRTIVIGEPTLEVRALEEASKTGADAALAVIKPGVTAGEIDLACRGAVHELKMGEFFRHRTGYSVGIGFTKWLDGFSLRPHDQTTVEENMVLHVIPFLSTGKLAVALSETVLVTAAGAERIPLLDRALFVR
jgi:Xaa-Pro dipeptidase